VEWLYIFGGILVLLWGAWLFTDFASNAAAAYVRSWIHHD
jgi:hypothetical protein